MWLIGMSSRTTMNRILGSQGAPSAIGSGSKRAWVKKEAAPPDARETMAAGVANQVWKLEDLLGEANENNMGR